MFTDASRCEWTCCELDGSYFKISKQLEPIFTALKKGESVKNLVDLIAARTSRAVSAPETVTILRRVFSELGIDLVYCEEYENAHIRIKQTEINKKENMIKLRMTVLNARMTYVVASYFTRLYNPISVFCSLILIVFLISHFIVSGVWHEASGDWVSLATGDGNTVLTIAASLALVAVGVFFHEIGHCAASISAGITPKRIGFGIFWIFPVLFSDVSEAWSLESGRSKAKIDVGGIYFQAIIVACYYAISCAVPAETALAFRSAVVYSLLSIGVSANPALRFDGYWFLVDILDMPNLANTTRRHVVGKFRQFSRWVKRRAPIRSSEKDLTIRKTAGLWLYFAFTAAYSSLFIAIAMSLFIYAYCAFRQLIAIFTENSGTDVSINTYAALMLQVLALCFIPIVITTIVGRVKLMIDELKRQQNDLR